MMAARRTINMVGTWKVIKVGRSSSKEGDRSK